MGLESLLASHGSRTRVPGKSPNIKTRSEVRVDVKLRGAFTTPFQNEQEFREEIRNKKE